MWLLSQPAIHCPTLWRKAVSSSAAIEALIEREKLPPSYRAIIDLYWRPLAAQIADWCRETQRPLVIGVNGGQGSGKTTLCRFLEEILLPEISLRAVTLSLDDFYQSKADRDRLAEKVHPLFAVRGVPGTHDAAFLIQTLDVLKRGGSTDIPRFDKAIDDRAPIGEGKRIEGPVDVILFEGWCVGAAPQPQSMIAAPVNDLEREEDQDGVWRGRVNALLEAEYRGLFAMIDRLVMLRAPGMETILANRREQERKLREANRGAAQVMSDMEVARFVQFYERLTRWMLAEMPARADIVYELAELRRRQKESGWQPE